MSEDKKSEDIIKSMKQQSSDDFNQSSEQRLESLLMEIAMNPNRRSTTRKQLIEMPSDGTISESIEGTFINSEGFIEDIKQDHVFMLDDGTSTGEIVVCQNCRGKISQGSLRRCLCGKTCCVIQGCGKVSRDIWFCCNWHLFLGYFGIGLR